MKKLLTIVLTLIISSAQSQDAKEALEKIANLKDQYGNAFDLKSYPDEINVIMIPLTDSPFKVYDQLKQAKFKANTIIIGGFYSPGGHGAGMPASHLMDGFVKRFGKEFTSIWLDTANDTFKALQVKGHAVITLAIKKKKVKEAKDYGNKLEDFMKAIKPLMK